MVMLLIIALIGGIQIYCESFKKASIFWVPMAKLYKNILQNDLPSIAALNRPIVHKIKMEDIYPLNEWKYSQ